MDYKYCIKAYCVPNQNALAYLMEADIVLLTITASSESEAIERAKKLIKRDKYIVESVIEKGLIREN